MDEEILKTIREKGLLLEKEVFDLIKNLDTNLARELLEGIESVSGQKMITRNTLSKNLGIVKNVVSKMQTEEKGVIESIIVKLGISLEITKERKVVEKTEEKKSALDYKIFYADTKTDKKLEVKDFTGHFRGRYQALQRILMQMLELQNNLVSIGKIGGDRQNLCFIGMVSEKRVTKNKNLIVKFEDLTGEISALVKFGSEVFEKADELQLDDVVGVKASGNRELAFIYDIFYPDSFVQEKTRFDEDACIAFLSDIHSGGERHLGKEFDKFLDWLNSDDETAKKIKYIFVVGDNIDGVGVFPGQESVLQLKTTKEQYKRLADYFKRIPKNITIFMCPGQHDATRVAEPQPIIGKRYAPDLYDVENLILVTNPTLVKLVEKEKEFRVLMYHGASIHNLISEIKELRIMKAHKSPAKAVKHMLKRRHLASSHGAPGVVYIPSAEKDPMVINEVPDILCTGEVHRLDIENYNGVLILTGSCWQAQTPYEEKVGNIPDPCKVPVFNLKTRELKIFFFGEDDKDYGSVEGRGNVKVEEKAA